MATREVVVWVCDVCGSDDMVETHVLSVDGVTKEAEACWPCWHQVLVPLIPFSDAGRPVKPVKVKRSQIVPFPGQAWKFTSHALIRMGERHVDPSQAAHAAEDPEISILRPDGESWTYTRGRVKVIAKPTKRLILTVAHRDEDDEALA